jgi:hypothetical protein
MAESDYPEDWPPLLNPELIYIQNDRKFTAKIQAGLRAIREEQLAAWEREKARRREAAEAAGTPAAGT